MAASFRTQPIDRRRMTAKDRAIYKPNQRLSAISRAKQYQAANAYRERKKPFATEQKPGTGGFTGGLWQQQERLAKQGNEKRRMESFRPEELVKPDIALKSVTDNPYGY